jgi:hypothetical protein
MRGGVDPPRQAGDDRGPRRGELAGHAPGQRPSGGGGRAGADDGDARRAFEGAQVSAHEEHGRRIEDLAHEGRVVRLVAADDRDPQRLAAAPLLVGQAAGLAGQDAASGRGREQIGVVRGPKEDVFQWETGAELTRRRWTDVGEERERQEVEGLVHITAPRVLSGGLIVRATPRLSRSATRAERGARRGPGGARGLSRPRDTSVIPGGHGAHTRTRRGRERARTWGRRTVAPPLLLAWTGR